MGQVLGIGGVFIRAKDPKAMTAWYARHLGIPDGEQGFWQAAGGPTVIAQFSETTDYFPTDQRVMLNLRVDDLDAVTTRLQSEGIEVRFNPDWDEDGSFGRFARIHDPEGNAIELWEPAAEHR
ncbi:VOC family protein [Shimia ponticola]|uniref:VOC family protein n=1 Tax=Shimia ponticola TaxID=2582893 RepID=UPI0011BF8327|nr:VOC family protein [Shimia ponticola]